MSSEPVGKGGLPPEAPKRGLPALGLSQHITALQDMMGRNKRKWRDSSAEHLDGEEDGMEEPPASSVRGPTKGNAKANDKAKAKAKSKAKAKAGEV